MNRGFTSIFADDLDNLISLKVSLGYSESTYLGRARQFDRYCSMKYEKADELTEGIVLNWLNRSASRAARICSFVTPGMTPAQGFFSSCPASFL